MSKNILILSVADLRHMSMIKIYTEVFDKHHIKYDVVCADVYGTIPDYLKGEVFAISLNTSNKSRLQKVPEFINYRRKALDYISKKKYDFIVVWGENAAVLFSNYLKGKKYCINVRDFDFPNGIYKYILNSTTKHAVFNTIPIDTKIDGLEIDNCIPVISINNSIIEESEAKNSFRSKGKPIRISYIGKIRFFETIKTVLEYFGNDKRYILKFCGSGAELLEDYIHENQISNVVLKGTFSPEDTYRYLTTTDIINACYGDGAISRTSKYALPIRFGYGPSLRMPVLVSQNTYMSEMVQQYQIGYVFEETTGIADLLYEWYTNLSFESYNDNCNRYLKKCNDINDYFFKVLMNSIEYK